MAESSTLGEYVRRNEFAQTAANWLGCPAGMRIATSRGSRPAPRNDMQKLAACQRLQQRGAGQIRRAFRIRPKYYFPLCPAAGERIVPSRGGRPAPRNDMQKHAAVCGCNYVVPWQIRYALRICPKHRSPPCRCNPLLQFIHPRGVRTAKPCMAKVLPESSTCPWVNRGA